MNPHWHINMYLYVHTNINCICGIFSGTGGLCNLSKAGLKEAGPAGSVFWWRLFRGAGGWWNGQDRLSSLLPVCLGWIGDYNSRCVIRSELYSFGCRVRRRVTRERLEGGGGGAPQESHFTSVKWIYGMCQVVFLPSPHTHTHTHTHPPPRFLTLIPPSCPSMALLSRKLPETDSYICKEMHRNSKN